MELNSRGVIIGFIITLLSIPIFFFLIFINGESRLSQGLIQLISVIAEAIVAFSGGMIAVFKFRSIINRRKAQERLESLLSGGIKEKLIERELRTYERDFLQKKYKETKDRKFDLDLRSPVFRLQGSLQSMHTQQYDFLTIPEQWSVRGFAIDRFNYPDIAVKFMRQGDEVAVEFSPFSKWVWDVYKIYNGQKVWLMSLREETFNHLKKGKQKIIVRVPLGTHELKQIRIGDYIQFSQANISTLGFGPGILTRVSFLRHYPSTIDLINYEGLENTFYNTKSAQAAAEEFEEIGNFKERIKRGGVYAIGVSLEKEVTQPYSK